MLILIGIDDTDMPDTRGTNQLAREIVRRLAPRWSCISIVRHQLLDDPRVPYTSHNGSASIAVEGDHTELGSLQATCRQAMSDWFIPGSDPGLCVAEAVRVSPVVTDFAHRCEREVVAMSDAVDAARNAGLHLEPLGGTGGGVIGALAAVGLRRAAASGRIVQWRCWPDDLSGPTPASVIRDRGVDIRELDSAAPIDADMIDVGKHMRPNLRHGGAVLFVRPHDDATPRYQAVRLH